MCTIVCVSLFAFVICSLDLYVVIVWSIGQLILLFGRRIDQARLPNRACRCPFDFAHAFPRLQFRFSNASHGWCEASSTALSRWTGPLIQL